MKFSRTNEGHLGLVFSLCVLVTACNPEEYYPTEELVEGADAFCAEAKDLNSCQQKADICQPAYEALDIDLNEPVFSACVANPDMWNPVYETPGDGDGSTPGDDEGTNPGDSDDESTKVPTLKSVNGKCSNVDSQYLWVMKEIKKKKVVKTTTKVKICHHTGNSRAHTLIIACPAVKAHVKHHDDYLGACEL